MNIVTVKTIIKIKSVHCTTIDGCQFNSRLRYNPDTGSTHVGTVWRAKDPNKSARAKDYYNANKEKVCASAREYYWDNIENVRATQQIYCDANRDKLRAGVNEYYANNKQSILRQKKCHYEDNKDNILTRNRNYRREHPIEKRDYVEPHHRCTRFNDRFEGSEGHHLTPDTIVYIPVELHQSVPHNIRTGKNMERINALALDFLSASTVTC